MKIFFLALFITLTFSSCRYFNVSPVDGISTENVTEKPKIEDLIGNWEIDKFSYDLIKQNEKFEFINFPEFIDCFVDVKEKKYHQLSGKWEIEKDFHNNYWTLKLVFDKSVFYEIKTIINYDLYQKNDHLILWTFIGDPDSGERFLFEKK